MIQHTRVICLEEIHEYVNRYYTYFLKRYRMDESIDPKYLVRNTTNEHEVFPSDNYIHEWLICEQLLGFVYFRRNSFNNCEVVMIDLEVKVPKRYYRKKKYINRKYHDKILEEIQ